MKCMLFNEIRLDLRVRTFIRDSGKNTQITNPLGNYTVTVIAPLGHTACQLPAYLPNKDKISRGRHRGGRRGRKQI